MGRLVRVALVLLALAVAALIVAFFSTRHEKTNTAIAGVQPPPAPQGVGVSFAFQGGPNLVFLCWSDSSPGVNFYDVEIVALEDGKPRQEVRYGVSTTSCGGAYGVGEYMFEPGVYHYAVRACNNGGCSTWADASGPERYWFSVPCTDATGNACAHPQDATAGR